MILYEFGVGNGNTACEEARRHIARIGNGPRRIAEEAEARAKQMLDVYADFAKGIQRCGGTGECAFPSASRCTIGYTACWYLTLKVSTKTTTLH